jgi:signal peptidase I
LKAVHATVASSRAGQGGRRAAVSWVVFALVCVAIWLAAGPAQLGGPAHYVMVDGLSMEPTYHQGDLVLTQAKPSYAVGEVVAYLPDIGQRFPVIHRIVATEGEGHYITQGDNRAQPDGWLATDANIYGAAWLHVPYGGTVITFLRQPATWLVAAVGLLGLGLIAGARSNEARSFTRRRGRHMQPHSALPARQGKSRPTSRNRSRHLAGYSLLPPTLILLAFTANAANLAIDGGTLEGFRIEAGPEVTTEAATTPPATVTQSTITLTGLYLLTYSTGTLSITLSEPAGAGGRKVTLAVEQPTLASLPPVETISEGETRADVPFTAGSDAGTYSITATSPGLIDGKAVITVIARTLTLQVAGAIGLGVTFDGIVTLAEPAPVGGIAISLTSRDPVIVGVDPPVLTIDEGEMTVTFSLMGNTEGTVLLTASAPGYREAMAEATMTSAP